MVTREVIRPVFSDLIPWPKHRRAKNYAQGQAGEALDKVKFVGSGKGAIALVLKYLAEKKVIPDKTFEIMVPDWIGYFVYNQIQPFAFPSKKFSDRTRAILVYHQYGYPQDMDKILEFANEKKLTVIENCAHALKSYYKGKLAGSFGDFSIYSFSKWVFCFGLGGVKSKFDDFYGYAGKIISGTPPGTAFVKDFAKFLYDRSLFSGRNLLNKYANLFINMSYALYGEALKPSRLATGLFCAKIDGEIRVRQERYQYFRNKAAHLGICDHLEPDGVTPFVIPIRCPEPKNKALLVSLRERGVITGLYHFDINRNLLEPKFVQCVWIPCHGGISDSGFGAITETVLKAL